MIGLGDMFNAPQALLPMTTGHTPSVLRVQQVRGLLPEKMKPHSISHLGRGWGLSPEGVLPEKENPLHLAFGAWEGDVARGGVAREREPHSILRLE